MEYQQKKEQILTNVQFHNLLSFNLVQNKLERNFRSIVDALLLNNTKTDALQDQTHTLQDQTHQIANQQATHKEQVTNQIANIQNALRQLNQKMAKLDLDTKPKNEGDSTQQPIKITEKEVLQKESSAKKLTGLDSQKLFFESDQNSKKMEELGQQIDRIKQKLPAIQLLEQSMETMQREITHLKGQLMAMNVKSVKSLKRDSIQNVSKKQLEVLRPMPRNSMNKSVIYQSTDPESKENKENISENQQVEALVPQMDVSEAERQFNGLHIEINTLNLCYEELKDLVSDLRKKDIKNSSHIGDIDDKQKKMMAEIRADTDKMQRDLKNIQISLLNMSTQPQFQVQKEEPKLKEKSQKMQRSSPSSTKIDLKREPDENQNFKNSVNDKLSKIQQTLLGFVSETEFNRFKAQTRNKSEQLEKQQVKLSHDLEEEVKKIQDSLIEKNIDIRKLNEAIEGISENIKENNAQADRKHHIILSKIEEIKKNLQNLREDVEFYQTMGAKDAKSENVEKVQKTIEVEVKSKEIESKSGEDLKKYLSSKLHDQRAYLVGLIRDLEKKVNSGNSLQQQIANIWDKLNEMNLFLGKKADFEDTKKNLIYLEKKIDRLANHLMKAQNSNEDARIAKTNWFCLSCDKNLLSYQGKVGRHIVWDSMPLKGTVKNVDKKGLPSLKREAK